MSTVGESKVVKSMQKSVGRAKEKILQNLGKVDRTADEIFDEHVGHFNKQQNAATRLQKELNNYIRCIRACAGASRALLEAVSEVYEPEWGGKELLTVNSQSVDILWNDFAHRLAEQVLIPLNTYQGQFPETKKKIEKRGRKLVDFDGERHALEALQSNPRRAEAKLARQREALEAAKRTYEVLNSELHEELPGLYNSRIVFLVSAMSTLFASEHIFHSETSKVFTELEGIVERLAKESAKGNLNFKVPSNAILNSVSDSPKEAKSGNGNVSPTSPVSKTISSSPSTPVSLSSPPSSPTEANNINSNNKDTHNHNNHINNKTGEKDKNSTVNNTSPASIMAADGILKTTSATTTTTTTTSNGNANANITTNVSSSSTTTSPTTTTTSPSSKMVNGSGNHGDGGGAEGDGENRTPTPGSRNNKHNNHKNKLDKVTSIDTANTRKDTITTSTTMTDKDKMTDNSTSSNVDNAARKLSGGNGHSLDAVVDAGTTCNSKSTSKEKDKVHRQKDETGPGQNQMMMMMMNMTNSKSKSDSSSNSECNGNTSSAKPNADLPANDSNNNNNATPAGVVDPEKPPVKPLHGILNHHGNVHANSKHNGDLPEIKESSDNKDTTTVANNKSGSESQKEPGVLYRVRATYRYQKEDVDELSFDAGEIIRVIEYDDPEEQEEGWLMGVKDNGEKGMFPANFTRPI